MDLAQKLAKTHHEYPVDNLGRRIYGTVTLVIVIGEDGALLDASYRRVIPNNAREPLLGNAAVKWVQLAAPFSAPPREIMRGQASVEIRKYMAFNP
jgi:TonB family protein